MLTNTQLSCRHLACMRGDRYIFSQLNFSVSNGEILQITGANGCGKTSLLRILASLAPAASGSVCWQGQLLQHCRPHYQQQLAYLRFNPVLKANLTVAENLHFACAALPKRIIIEQALAQVGLSKVMHTLALQLSAGQQRRAVLAQLLVRDACLWILDEPFVALDSAGKSLLQAMIVQHTKAGGIAIITAHQAFQLEDVPVKTLELS